MKSTIIYILGLFCLSSVTAQTPRPADPQSEPIAIMNATAHVGNGEVIENSFVLFSAGRIVAVGNATNTRPDLEGYRQIDASGKHIYPGLIMPTIRLGLEDISAVRPTRDYAEVGAVTPHVRSQIAFNTDSDLLPTFRFNGIMLAQVTPMGGRVPGTSSVMTLDGWNWEDATYLKDDAVHVNWPAKSYGPRWWMGETNRRPNESYDDQVAQILDLLEDARSYHALTSKQEINLKLEAMKGVLDGSQRLFVEANRGPEIVQAITQLKRAGVQYVVLTGGRDAWYVRELLKEHNIPVVLDNVHRRPSREGEDVDFPYRMPGMLHREGIKVSLRHVGMLSRGRNLPFYAGTVAAYGVDKEDALQMITSNTAEILGIANRTGTIEAEKDANLVISDGDLLDMRSSVISYAFIQGREVIIEGKQQELFERFKEKYSE